MSNIKVLFLSSDKYVLYDMRFTNFTMKYNNRNNIWQELMR